MGTGDIADIGQGGIIVLLGTVLSMFSGFLFRMVGARFLTTNQFGSIVLGTSIVNILSIPCLFGLNQGVTKYLASEKSKCIRDTYITFSIVLTALLGVGMTIIGIVFKSLILSTMFSEGTPDILIYIFLLTIPLFTILKLLGGILRGEMNSQGFVSVSKIIQPGSKLALTLIAILVFGSPAAVAGAFFISILLTSLTGMYYIWKGGWRPMYDQSAKFKPLISFSVPLLFSSSVFILLSYIDKILIGYYLVNNEVAIYEVAVTIVGLLGLFRSAFGFLLYPKLTKQVTLGDTSKVSTMYRQTTKWILGLTTPAFAILLFRPEFLVMVFGDKYSTAEIAPILMFLGFGLFLNAVVGPNGEAMLGFGQSRSVLLYNMMAVITNVILNIILIPKYHLVGAAVASMIGYIIMNIAKSVDLYLRHQVPVLAVESIVMSIASFTFCAAILSFSPTELSSFLELVLLCCTVILGLTVGIGTLWVLDDITEEDKELALKVTNSIL